MDDSCFYDNQSTSKFTNVYAGDAGVEFLIGVDYYQMVVRTLKYSFIIILLTYLAVLFSEIVVRHPIPLLNYFLIGAALVLFYSLLVSLSEIIAFRAAYLVASFMIVGLITTYMWKVLDSTKVAISIFALLTIIYTTVYILIGMSTYALLFGSLLLFAILALLMYCTVLIDRRNK